MARNYRSSRNNDVAGKVILSIVLVVVLLGMIVGGAVAGWFAHKDGWFDKKTDDTEKQEQVEDAPETLQPEETEE